MEKIFCISFKIFIQGLNMNEKVKKKTIENSMFCHKINVLIEEDDYGVLTRYKEWAGCTMNEAVNSVISYSLRIIRNILKYHKNYNNLTSLIEDIAAENEINLESIKSQPCLYEKLYYRCLHYCEHRCEYTPYERSYWYDILMELKRMEALIDNKKIIISN